LSLCSEHSQGLCGAGWVLKTGSQTPQVLSWSGPAALHCPEATGLPGGGPGPAPWRLVAGGVRGAPGPSPSSAEWGPLWPRRSGALAVLGRVGTPVAAAHRGPRRPQPSGDPCGRGAAGPSPSSAEWGPLWPRRTGALAVLSRVGTPVAAAAPPQVLSGHLPVQVWHCLSQTGHGHVAWRWAASHAGLGGPLRGLVCCQSGREQPDPGLQTHGGDWPCWRRMLRACFLERCFSCRAPHGSGLLA